MNYDMLKQRSDKYLEMLECVELGFGVHVAGTVWLYEFLARIRRLVEGQNISYSPHLFDFKVFDCL